MNQAMFLFKKNWLHPVIWILIFEAIGFILGIVTKNQIHGWYDGLTKSNLTPAPIVFSVVWSVLYALLAIISWSLWQHSEKPSIRPTLYCFFMQLLMNFAWTPLFFQLHWIGFSFLWLGILTCLTLVTIYLMKKNNNRLFFLLTPYFVWLLYATFLNGEIWLNN